MACLRLSFPFVVLLFSTTSALANETKNLYQRYVDRVGTSDVTVTNQSGATLASQWSNSSSIAISGYASRAGLANLLWKNLFWNSSTPDGSRLQDSTAQYSQASPEALSLLPPSGTNKAILLSFNLDYLPVLPATKIWVLRANAGVYPNAGDLSQSPPGMKLSILLADGVSTKLVHSVEIKDTVIPLFIPLSQNSFGGGRKLVFKVESHSSTVRNVVILDYPTIEQAQGIWMRNEVTSAEVARVSHADGTSILGATPVGIPTEPDWPKGYFGTADGHPNYGIYQTYLPGMVFAPPGQPGQETVMSFPLAVPGSALQFSTTAYRLVGKYGMEQKTACASSGARVLVSFSIPAQETLSGKSFPANEEDFLTPSPSSSLSLKEISPGQVENVDIPLGLRGRLQNPTLRIRLFTRAGAAPCTSVVFDGLAVVAASDAPRVGIQFLPDWGNFSGTETTKLNLLAQLFSNPLQKYWPNLPYTANGGFIRVDTRSADIKEVRSIAESVATIQNKGFKVILLFQPRAEEYAANAPFNPANDGFTGESNFRLTHWDRPRCVANADGTVTPATPCLPDYEYLPGVTASDDRCRNPSLGSSAISFPAPFFCANTSEFKKVTAECIHQTTGRAQRTPFTVLPHLGGCAISLYAQPDLQSETTPAKYRSGVCLTTDLGHYPEGAIELGWVEPKAVYNPPCLLGRRPEKSTGSCFFSSGEKDNAHPYVTPSCMGRFEWNTGAPRYKPGFSYLDVNKFRDRVALYMSEIGKVSNVPIAIVEEGNELNSAFNNDDFDITRPFNEMSGQGMSYRTDAQALAATASKYRELLIAIRTLRTSSPGGAWVGTQLLMG